MHAEREQAAVMSATADGCRQQRESRSNAMSLESVQSHSSPSRGQPFPQDVDTLKRRIRQYDQAAKPLGSSSFASDWAVNSSVWGSRIGIGKAVDAVYTAAPGSAIHRLAEQTASRLAPIAERASTYNELLGIGVEQYQRNSDVSWKKLLSNRQNRQQFWQGYLKTLQGNFSGCLRPESGFLSVFRQTVFKNNALSMYWHLTDPETGGVTGKVGLAAGRCFGVLFSGWDVLSNTKQAYINAKSREDGSIAGKVTTWAKTTGTFLSQSVKAALCWEIGTIGFTIGTSVLCLGFWPSLLGGVVIGGLFSTIADRILSKVIKKPEKL